MDVPRLPLSAPNSARKPFSPASSPPLSASSSPTSTPPLTPPRRSKRGRARRRTEDDERRHSAPLALMDAAHAKMTSGGPGRGLQPAPEPAGVQAHPLAHMRSDPRPLDRGAQSAAHAVRHARSPSTRLRPRSSSGPGSLRPWRHADPGAGESVVCGRALSRSRSPSRGRTRTGSRSPYLSGSFSGSGSHWSRSSASSASSGTYSFSASVSRSRDASPATGSPPPRPPFRLRLDLHSPATRASDSSEYASASSSSAGSPESTSAGLFEPASAAAAASALFQAKLRLVSSDVPDEAQEPQHFVSVLTELLESHRVVGDDSDAEAAARAELASYEMACSQVAPRLFVSGAGVAESRAALAEHGITHVLNVAGLDVDTPFGDELVYCVIGLSDSRFAPLLSIVGTALGFVSAALADPNAAVLIHCSKGVSRSAAVAVAYLMWARRWTYDESLAAVSAARPIVRPNAGFECALIEWHAVLNAPIGQRPPRLYYLAPLSLHAPGTLVLKPVDLLRRTAGAPVFDPRLVLVLRAPDVLSVWVGPSVRSSHACHLGSTARDLALLWSTFEGDTSTVAYVRDEADLAPFAAVVAAGADALVPFADLVGECSKYDVEVSLLTRPTEALSAPGSPATPHIRFGSASVSPAASPVASPRNGMPTPVCPFVQRRGVPRLYRTPSADEPEWDEFGMFDIDDLWSARALLLVPYPSAPFVFVWVGSHWVPPGDPGVAKRISDLPSLANIVSRTPPSSLGPSPAISASASASSSRSASPAFAIDPIVVESSPSPHDVRLLASVSLAYSYLPSITARSPSSTSIYVVWQGLECDEFWSFFVNG